MDIISQTRTDFQKNQKTKQQNKNLYKNKSEKPKNTKSIDEIMKAYDMRLYINKVRTEKLLKRIPQIIKDSKKRQMEEELKKSKRKKKKRKNRTAKKKKKWR